MINTKKLKQARKEMKINQTQLGHRIGLKLRRYQELEKTGNINMERLAKIVERLNQPIIENGFKKTRLKPYTINDFIK